MLYGREGADVRMAGREALEGEVAVISGARRMGPAVIVAAVAAVAVVMVKKQEWADFHSDDGMG